MRTPKRGNLFFLFVMLSQVFVILFVSPALMYMLSQQGQKINIPFLNTFAQLFSFVVPFLIYLAVTGQHPGDALPHKKLNFTNILLITGMVIAIRPTCQLISGISSLFFKSTSSSFMSELYSYPIAIVIFTVCIVPPIAEEIILRGATLDNYDSVGIKKAAFINGLFFGFLHLNYQQFFYTFFIGFIFTYLVRYTKSIYSSILAHFIFNFAQVAQLYVFISSYGYDKFKEEMAATPATGDMVYSLLIQSISAAIMLPIFIILFLAFIRYNVIRNLIDEFLADNPDLEDESVGIQPNMEITGEPEHSKGGIFDWAFALIIVTYALTMIFVFG